jgi:hypothetical protein
VAVASSHSYQVDPNWYSETGATDYITSDLDRLTMREQYHGGDTVQVGNGAGLRILHTGSCSGQDLSEQANELSASLRS